MPIRIPDKLPARETLTREGVAMMTESQAARQDIRPLRIGLLNLMPDKIRTETQFARLLGSSPLQIELVLVRIGQHKSKNTSEDHLLDFYEKWENIKHLKFDGFIITGAPIELLDLKMSPIGKNWKKFSTGLRPMCTRHSLCVGERWRRLIIFMVCQNTI